MTVVFSEAWFEQHQVWLLRLLSWPIVGRVMRRVLAIRPHDVGWRHPIVQMTPHSYTVAHGDDTYTLDCRTHAKFAKRLHYILWPLWAALHAWDAWVANPFVPALNAGFDTLTVYPDAGDPGSTTVDGIVRVFLTDTFLNLRNNAGNSTWNSASDNGIQFQADVTASLYTNIYRSLFTFNTSSLTNNARISAATLSLYGSGSASDTGSINPSIDVTSAAPAFNNTLSPTDYSTLGTTSFSGSPISVAAWASSYNVFTLNASGRANVSVTGISRFGARESTYDMAGISPTWSSGTSMGFPMYFADQTGTTNDPRLEVTYELSSRLLSPNRLRPRVFAPGRAR